MKKEIKQGTLNVVKNFPIGNQNGKAIRLKNFTVEELQRTADDIWGKDKKDAS